MAFRDDREVLKQKARDLERDLANAESKLAAQQGEADRARELEAELAAAKATLERIEARLPKPHPTRSRTGLIAGGVIAVGACAGGFFLLRSSPAPAPPPSMVQYPAVQTVPVAPVTVTPISPTPPAPVPTVATPSAPDPVKEVRTYWAGKAKTVSGGPIKVGAACKVEAVLRSTDRHEVTVSCGSEVLYRSTDALSGHSMFKTGVDEYPAEKAGKARAVLGWSDIGTRTGPRTQASINTEARVASAWSETAPSFRVDIEIPTLSEAYEGTFAAGHSHDDLPFQERVERNAKVTKTTGKAPIQAGTSCRARLSPNWDERLDCRVLLWCGSRTLYGSGSTGFSKCEATDGKPTAFRDETQEGDPMLTWDIAKRTITLVVEEGGSEWSADFSVAEK